LEGLKQQQAIMQEELYSELKNLKLEQELQEKKNLLYAELTELKSQQLEMIHESILQEYETSTSVDYEESVEYAVDSNEETVQHRSPVKSVAFQEEVESSEEEFYY
jgi:hypothetical protein